LGNIKKQKAAAVPTALDLTSNRGKCAKAISHGAASYVKDVAFDKDTGEVFSP